MNRIDRISYSRTKNVNHSDAECIEISAFVDSQDENEQDAILEYLRAWVENKMQLREKTTQLYNRKNQLTQEIQSLEDDLQVAKNKWSKAKEFMDKVGINSVDDIPF